MNDLRNKTSAALSLGGLDHDPVFGQVGASQCAAVPEREKLLRLLREGATEIRNLRNRLQVQDAKVNTMELIAGVGRAQGPPSYRDTVGYGTDVALQIDRALAAAAAADHAQPVDGASCE
jgi:hypothetical protein